MTLISASYYRAPKMDLFLVLLYVIVILWVYFFLPLLLFGQQQELFCPGSKVLCYPEGMEGSPLGCSCVQSWYSEELNKATVRTFLLLEVGRKKQGILVVAVTTNHWNSHNPPVPKLKQNNIRIGSFPPSPNLDEKKNFRTK